MSISSTAETAETVIHPPRGLFDLDLGEIWQYRELIYFFAWRDIKVRYKQTMIGAAWAVIQPLLGMLVFTLVFGRFAGLPSGDLPGPVFYYSGLIAWTYFANGISASTNTMVDNQRVITKIYFPRLILPMSAVLPGLVDLGIAMVILVGLMLIYGIAISPLLLLLPVFVLLAVATAFGAGLWLAALNAQYRDVRYAVPFLVQMWFFATPIVYPSEMIPASWRWVIGLNPISGVVDGFRWCISGGGEAPDKVIFLSIGAVIVLVLGGVVFFRNSETRIADVV